MTTPTFTAMDHSTKEEWDRIARASIVDWSNTPDRILAMLRELTDITNGFAVDQLTHVLQTATRAERAGADPEARQQYAGHPSYALAERFADEWDQTSFDPDYDTLPLEHFEPAVREVFAAPRYR